MFPECKSCIRDGVVSIQLPSWLNTNPPCVRFPKLPTKADSIRQTGLIVHHRVTARCGQYLVTFGASIEDPLERRSNRLVVDYFRDRIQQSILRQAGRRNLFLDSSYPS